MLCDGRNAYHLRSRVVQGVPSDEIKRHRPQRRKSRCNDVCEDRVPKVPKNPPKQPVNEEEFLRHATPAQLETRAKGLERLRLELLQYLEQYKDVDLSRKACPDESEEEATAACVAQDLQCAEAGVSFLNDPCRKMDANYELVEALMSSGAFTPDGFVYHANFVAKPTNSEAKPLLFFVELLCESCDQEVKLCVPLGPTSSESAATGLNGCRICSGIHHPTSGGFKVDTSHCSSGKN